MDPITELIRHAAIRVSGVNVLPDCLKSASSGEQIGRIHALIERVENHLQCEADWVQARHPGPKDTTWEERRAWLNLTVPHLARTIPDNIRLQEIIRACLPTVPMPDALSIIMRLWAGCLAAAKVLREKKVVNGGKTEDNSPAERGLRMQDIDTTAQEDEIYAAAVPVGPHAKRHKRKPEPETVIYTGIPEALQRQYFSDDIRQNPTPPGAVTL